MRVLPILSLLLCPRLQAATMLRAVAPEGAATPLAVTPGAGASELFSAPGTDLALPVPAAPLATEELPGLPAVRAENLAAAIPAALNVEAHLPPLAVASPIESRVQDDAPAAPPEGPAALGSLAAVEKAASSGEGSAGAAAPLDAAYDGGLLSRYRAPPGMDGQVDLSRIDPWDSGPYREDGKGKARRRLKKDLARLDKLQQVLYANGQRPVLIVLQGMDTGGKDGVISHVMRGLNPQGVSVHSFKKPTAEEAAHHFLWRILKALPGKGMIGILNRSQYEDILVPSVYGTFPPEEVESRYDVINRFEKEFVEQGGIILKFFLHISKDEQKRRLQERLDDPDKNWKFSPEDLKSREKWPQFLQTYGKILARTNTDWAPWYVIPANHKWLRDLLVARILRKTLQRLGLSYPPPLKDADKIVIPD